MKVTFAAVTMFTFMACQHARTNTSKATVTIASLTPNPLPAGQSSVLTFVANTAGPYVLFVRDVTGAAHVLSRGQAAAGANNSVALLASVLQPGDNALIVRLMPPGEANAEATTTLTLSVSCSDQIADGSETDVDCGGNCPPCTSGAKCAEDSDCQSQTCHAAVCVIPSCTDGFIDGDETASDCGGSCPSCALGVTCVHGSDCSSGACIDAVCAVPPCPFTVADPSAPVLYFSDLESGPKTGGENDLGVFVTLYGQRLGSAPGKVTLGGVEVGKYVQWGPYAAQPTARGLETIVLQLGAGVPNGLNDFVVTANGKSSNALPFTVRAGNIWLVDPAASGGGAGTFANPFNSLYAPRDVAFAGDTVYVKGKASSGVYNDADPDATADSGANETLVLQPSNAASGTAGNPIAYIGYPGNPPILGGVPGKEDNVFWLPSGDTTPPVEYYTVANMTLQQNGGQGNGFRLSGHGQRVIGITFTKSAIYEPLRNDPYVSTGAQVLGNLFTNSSGDGMWIGVYGTNGIEIGWNEITSQSNHGIHLGGFLTTDFLFNPVVHDNLVYNNGGDGILIGGGGNGDQVGGGVFYNNVFFNNRDCFFLQEATPFNAAPFTFAHNTCYQDTNIELEIDPGGTNNTLPGVPNRFVLRNNIFYSGVSEYFANNGDPTAYDAASDLYFNASSPTFFPSSGGTLDNHVADPHFSNRATDDLTLATSSPALDTAVPTSVCSDYNGLFRPAGAGPDLGAFEHY